MTIPTLFDYYRSSASYRVRIALNLKGIAFRSVPIDLSSGEQKGQHFRDLNPQGFVPMLEEDGRRITQSLAIIDYLDATRPNSPLMPRDPVHRAHVLALALTVACDIHPLNNLRVLKHLVGPLGASEELKTEWIARWIGEGFAALEALAGQRSGLFLFGNAPTVADICLVPQMYNARRFAVPLDDFPLLLQVDARMTDLDPVAAAHPDRVAPPS